MITLFSEILTPLGAFSGFFHLENRPPFSEVRVINFTDKKCIAIEPRKFILGDMLCRKNIALRKFANLEVV